MPEGHAIAGHGESVPGNPTLDVSGKPENRNVSVENERSMVVSKIDMNSRRVNGLSMNVERVRSGKGEPIVEVGVVIILNGNMAGRPHRSIHCLQHWLTFLSFPTGSMIFFRGIIPYLLR
jgi:hypothetical protein